MCVWLSHDLLSIVPEKKVIHVNQTETQAFFFVKIQTPCDYWLNTYEPCTVIRCFIKREGITVVYTCFRDNAKK